MQTENINDILDRARHLGENLRGVPHSGYSFGIKGGSEEQSLLESVRLAKSLFPEQTKEAMINLSKGLMQLGLLIDETAIEMKKLQE